MKIISENAEIITPEKTEGTKRFEFTLDLSLVKKNNGKTLSDKIKSAAEEFSNEFLKNAYISVANVITDLENSENKEAKSYLSCLERSNSCSYVYWGCGSCTNGRARVDAYCGSGGSQPDYSWCENC